MADHDDTSMADHDDSSMADRDDAGSSTWDPDAQSSRGSGESRILVNAMRVSIATALVTMAIKSGAAWVTGSAGLLSDALESSVNLVAAIAGLAALRIAERPPDSEHQLGHGKAEYVAAAFEGAMVVAAAAAILAQAVPRLFDPRPIDEIGLGLGLGVAAAVFNGIVGVMLVRVGRRHRSEVLIADGRHLLTDVATSIGVVAAVGVVAVTGWDIADPVIAVIVGIHVGVVGINLLRRSASRMLDRALPEGDVARIAAIVEEYRERYGVDVHALTTRESGRRRFITCHLLVPGDWTVSVGHALCDSLQNDIADALPGALTLVHLEPLGDPSSYLHHGVFDAMPPAD